MFVTGNLDIVGDGHPQLVGTAGRWKRCDSSEFYVDDDAPGPGNNWVDWGLPLKTIWVQVDSLIDPTAIEGLWIKIAEDADVAVWLPLPSGGSFSGDAGDVPFTPTGTIAATDTQAAVAEVASEAATATAAVASALATHEADPADAHDASAVSLVDTAGDFTATDVEGALAELFTLIGTGAVTQVWEAVTDGEDVLVWEDDDLVHEWRPYP